MEVANTIKQVINDAVERGMLFVFTTKHGGALLPAISFFCDSDSKFILEQMKKKEEPRYWLLINLNFCSC